MSDRLSKRVPEATRKSTSKLKWLKTFEFKHYFEQKISFFTGKVDQLLFRRSVKSTSSIISTRQQLKRRTLIIETSRFDSQEAGTTADRLPWSQFFKLHALPRKYGVFVCIVHGRTRFLLNMASLCLYSAWENAVPDPHLRDVRPSSPALALRARAGDSAVHPSDSGRNLYVQPGVARAFSLRSSNSLRSHLSLRSTPSLH